MLLSTVLGGELFLKWLLESAGGVRWLLGAVSKHTPVTISAKTITGGLDSALHLEGLSAGWPGGDLAISDVHLRCSPIRIPFGYLAVRELSLRGVRFRDSSPSELSEPGISWPHITGISTKLHGWIDLFTISDATYQKQKHQPVKIPDASASLLWQNSKLSISKLSLKTPEGVLSGTISAGFDIASLDSSLSFEPSKPLAGCNKIQLNSKLHAGQSPEQVTGDVTINALSGVNTKYSMTGDIGVTRKELNLHRLTVTEKGRSGLINLSGILPLTGEANIKLSASGVDLTRELGKKVTLSGTLDLKGGSGLYAGKFTVASGGEGYLKYSATGRLHGDFEGIELSILDAAVLGGAVLGELRCNWRSGVVLKGALHGKGLNPAIIDPAWNGVVNFDLDSFMAKLAGGRLQQGEMQGRLKESRLRGKALSGEIAATMKKDDLNIKRLFLTGNGFNVTASGILSQRLDMKADITELSGLIPQAHGALALRGWGRYAAGVVSGAATGHASKLKVAGIQIGSATLSAGSATGVENDTAVVAKLNNVTYRGVHAENVSLKVDGTLQNHRLVVALTSSDAGVIGQLSGGYSDGRWQGKLTDFLGHDTVGPCRLVAPVALTISADYLEVAPLIITGLASERVELSGRFYLKPRAGKAAVNWNRLNLARANRWLKEANIDGESSGELRLGVTGDNLLTLTGMASVAGSATLDRQMVTITKARLDLDAGAGGTTVKFDLRTREGISATGRFISPAAATFSLPTSGELNAAWEGLDPAVAKRWLPKGSELRGRLSGTVSGRFLPERRYDLDGTATLVNGSGSWRDNGRELTVAVREAGLSWSWRDDSLRGSFSLSLAELGDSKGDFRLPLPARFGSAIDPSGQIKGRINGTFKESGVVNALFPGLLQEARSLVKVDLNAGGTWQNPTISGRVDVTQAGAYIPSAGIRVTDVQLAARLDTRTTGTDIKIEKFRLTSGKGFLEGSAGISFTGSSLTGYQGSLHGERFHALNLPEQQMVISPEITFSGGQNQLSVRGSILVPEMLLRRFNSSAEIKPSKDVVIIAHERTVPLENNLVMDLQLQILLGDKVFIKYGGLDARLEGGMKIAMTDLSKATGTGEIKVAKGSYRIYGVNLEIQRGRALFSGGSVERPTLDILALRTVDDVRAGVTVTGTPDEPLIKLYSEPTLPDTEILSYAVLGHTLGESRSQGGKLMEAAALFVSSEKSTGLQEQLKEWVALDTIAVSSGKDQRSGYKIIEPSMRGNLRSTTNANGLSQTMLELGKYLTPKLYLSYGKSLFDQSQQIRARYSISKRWEVESKFSTVAAGGDLLYRIELK